MCLKNGGENPCLHLGMPPNITMVFQNLGVNTCIFVKKKKKKLASCRWSNCAENTKFSYGRVYLLIFTLAKKVGVFFF